MHKFNPADHKKLTSELRYRLMPPGIIADEVRRIADESVKKNKPVNIADVGSGNGFFTIPILKRFHDKDIALFAVDISKDMLDLLKESVRKEDPEGVFTSKLKLIKCKESSLSLTDESMNIIFMSNVFHEITDKHLYLNEIKRVLKKGGYFILVDWKKEDDKPKMGPPSEERVSTDEAVKFLISAGFDDIKILPFYASVFSITCRKKP